MGLELSRTRLGRAAFIVVCAVAWASACGGSSETPPEPATDAGGLDAAKADGTTSTEGGPGPDAGPALDAATDGQTQDVVIATDAPADSPADVAVDAPADAGPDVDAGPCGTLSATFGAAVPLQNPTATISQQIFGDFRVSKAVDGLTNNAVGWGVAPSDGGATLAQTAAFETVTNTPNVGATTRLVFVLDQTFSPEHALGRFRLSATTSARTAFADGNEGISTPGDVGASGIWTVLTPLRKCANTGAAMTVLGDQSIRVADLDSTNAIYLVEADTALTGITGFRIEVLEDALLPQSGPGLQNSNGNFVLTEFAVRVGAP